MVNKTELQALDWLKAQGYDVGKIRRGEKGEPDFICQDGKRYEVKFLYANKILIRPLQHENFKDDDKILVFGKDGFAGVFDWRDKDTQTIAKLSYVQVGVMVGATVTEELWKRYKFALIENNLEDSTVAIRKMIERYCLETEAKKKELEHHDNTPKNLEKS